MPNRHFLRSDIFTFAMVYSFYFRLFSLMNQRVDLFFFVYYNSASVMVLNQYISEETIFSEIDFFNVSA